MAAQYQVPLLGQLPLAKGIREQADKGEPSVIANQGAGDEFAEYYLNIAKISKPISPNLPKRMITIGFFKILRRE